MAELAADMLAELKVWFKSEMQAISEKHMAALEGQLEKRSAALEGHFASMGERLEACISASNRPRRSPTKQRQSATGEEEESEDTGNGGCQEAEIAGGYEIDGGHVGGRGMPVIGGALGFCVQGPESGQIVGAMVDQSRGESHVPQNRSRSSVDGGETDLEKISDQPRSKEGVPGDGGLTAGGKDDQRGWRVTGSGGRGAQIEKTTCLAGVRDLQEGFRESGGSATEKGGSGDISGKGGGDNDGREEKDLKLGFVECLAGRYEHGYFYRQKHLKFYGGFDGRRGKMSDLRLGFWSGLTFKIPKIVLVSGKSTTRSGSAKVPDVFWEKMGQ